MYLHLTFSIRNVFASNVFHTKLPQKNPGEVFFSQNLISQSRKISRKVMRQKVKKISENKILMQQ